MNYPPMPPREETFDALYNLNKHAKKYAELGTKNYRKGKKTTAKANSNKKKALYAVKERVLAELLDAVDWIEIHEIDGRDFYCLYFQDGEWSFHTPVENLDITDDRVTTHEVLDDFEKTSEKERSSNSLKASLLYIESEFGVNANNHLPGQYLWYGSNRHFIGWKYLGETGDDSDEGSLDDW